MPDPRIVAPAFGFEGPVKRSITIAGHQTSISLEPAYWRALELAATAHALPLSALVAQIDVLRIAAAEPPNLASALRSWLFAARLTAQDLHATPVPEDGPKDGSDG